jgi:hypothetical protein
VAFALLFSLPAGTAAAADALADRWRSQGVAAILPSYVWAREARVSNASASAARAGISPWSAALLRRVGGREATALGFQGAASRFTDSAASHSDRGPALHLAQSLPFGAGWFDSALTFGLGEGARVEAGAILVYQRFATWEFGRLPPPGPMAGAGAERRVEGGLQERAYGYGVRLGYRLALDSSTELAVETQSRVDMEPFKTFRGVYSDVGDFDVPAVVGVAIRSQLLPKVALSARLQRVYFSGVRPFTSAALPVRLLALLGDASAPRFAWEDLDLLSAELSFVAGANDRLGLAVSSRQVPLPSARILREALADEAPSYQLSLAYERGLGEWGRLSARFAYAPRQGFLALGPFQDRSDPSRRQREFDLAWTLGF